LSSTERGYDLLAPNFDASPFRTPDPLLDAVREALRADGPWDRALDLCCGTGAGLRALGPRAAQITGLDFSRGMLERARLSHDHDAAWVRADALELPFREAFDLIVTFGALGHILPADQTRFLDGVWHALRPGGTFCLVTTPMPPFLTFSHLAARGFNALMHVRNAVLRPPFVMYYLTFLLPGVAGELRRQGFLVDLRPLPGFRHELTLVVASRPAQTAKPA
jgi:SAM-dependent methyltransferase